MSWMIDEKPPLFFLSLSKFNPPPPTPPFSICILLSPLLLSLLAARAGGTGLVPPSPRAPKRHKRGRAALLVERPPLPRETPS